MQRPDTSPVPEAQSPAELAAAAARQGIGSIFEGKAEKVATQWKSGPAHPRDPNSPPYLTISSSGDGMVEVQVALRNFYKRAKEGGESYIVRTHKRLLAEVIADYERRVSTGKVILEDVLTGAQNEFSDHPLALQYMKDALPFLRSLQS